ncbi:hypothetical protein DACRYDRAFT_114226 [Dacryopinax primogenitus]|uniref:Zn(2)-C6 fungal-type domain-containing protein n=1 Tax=Dacryopinax primogenitus (strain DJM 731) TaxID=1858805 RepID=M5G819_DACPD|nr:uncharacterized protein DACRYDRAFT_114226 [Dacryopinax primogenitus]EJU04909.1 hypothetical protein DACRYDRAFT_114226 [Dacryopinax primogenitus]
MSSGEEDYDELGSSKGRLAEDDDDNPASKKRRIQRACDVCRRKKIRCDGPTMPNNRCSNCLAYHHECTYIEAAKKRGPPKGYVEALENRVVKMEAVLARMFPGEDFSAEIGPPVSREAYMSGRPPPAEKPHSLLSKLGQHSSQTRQAPAGIPLPVNPDPKEDDLYSSDDDLIIQGPLTERMKNIDITGQRRYHGKSSGFMLVAAARDLKREYTGGPPAHLDLEVPVEHTLRNRRPEFWQPYEWELRTWANQEWRVPVEWPEEDLMNSLIELYFENSNNFWPLLHRPTFDKLLADKLHERDMSFTAVVMLTLAVGSRYSDDPRVLIDPNATTRHSAGWKYFEQIKNFRKTIMARPSLFDLQIFVLSCIFLQGSSVPHACWTVVGVGLRFAQDVGAHRQKSYRGGDMVDDELWKRAFWCLVAMDRMVSSALGLPCAIHDEDFDVEFPHECDDEHWEPDENGKRFVQPNNKPSKVSFFLCYLRLMQILAFALRTIYSINKSKVLLGFVGARWEQHIVAELDSALNKWIDSVPAHLKWDPSVEDSLWFDQSATLFSTYYQLQILIHRPFIPSPRRPSPLSFPSLAICSNAARSSAHICEHVRRRKATILPGIIVSAFTSGIVLLINVWGGKKTGMKLDPTSQLQDTHNCMQVLKMAERSWNSAGRLWDILCELASFGDLPLPQASPPDFTGSNKRERSSENSPGAAQSSSTSSTTLPVDGVRPIAKAPTRSTSNSYSNSPAASASFPPSVTATPPEGYRNVNKPTVISPDSSTPSSTLPLPPDGGYPSMDVRSSAYNEAMGNYVSPTAPASNAQSSTWFVDPQGPQNTTPITSGRDTSTFSYPQLQGDALMSLFGSDPMSFFAEPSQSFNRAEERTSGPSQSPGGMSYVSNGEPSVFNDMPTPPQTWPGQNFLGIPQPPTPGVSSFANAASGMPAWSGGPYGFGFESWTQYFSNQVGTPSQGAPSPRPPP